MTASRTCVMQAPAKVNLFLHVGLRREDGFHEIDTLYQAVSLCDDVHVQRTSRDIALTVHGPDLGPLNENLAARAARAFLDEIGSDEGVRVELTKYIPAGAGLGGGSSDAAAVLRCMNELWDHPVTDARLRWLGARLGSDVPFFLGEGPLARGTGRGEILEPLPPLPPVHLVLVLPPVHVATGGAYAALARERVDRGTEVAQGSAWRSPAVWTDVEAVAHNDFQDVLIRSHPEVAFSLEALRGAGGRPTLLSGSGGACFGVLRDEETAQAVADRLQAELEWPTRAVHTLAAFPAPACPEAPGLEGPPPLG